MKILRLSTLIMHFVYTNTASQNDIAHVTVTMRQQKLLPSDVTIHVPKTPDYMMPTKLDLRLEVGVFLSQQLHFQYLLFTLPLYTSTKVFLTSIIVESVCPFNLLVQNVDNNYLWIIAWNIKVSGDDTNNYQTLRYTFPF